MAITRFWNEGKPLGADFGSTLDNQIQDMKEDIHLRLLQGGHVWDTQAATEPLAEVGFHAVDAGGAGIGPDIYKSDRLVKIMQFADALVTLPSAFAWAGGQNFGRTLLGEDAVPVDEVTTAKGYKHATEGFRVDESSTPNTLVNVSTGVYAANSGAEPRIFAGGTIDISGAKTGMIANDERFSLLFLTNAGALAFRNGVVANPGPPTDVPQLGVGETALALIHVFDNTTNFARDGSDPDAFLIRDGRVDAPVRLLGGIKQVLQSSANSIVNQTTVIISKGITTTGGIVIAIGMISGINMTNEPLVIGRAGVPIGAATIHDVGGDQDGGLVVGIEALPADNYTYELRSQNAFLTRAHRIWLIELGVSAFS